MRKKNKAAAGFIIALVMALFALIGCEKPAAPVNVLYDTESLYIEREGAETRVYDRAGNKAYAFISRRVKVEAGTLEEISEGKTAADTETIKIQTVHGVIIVTEKETGTTLYIKSR